MTPHILTPEENTALEARVANGDLRLDMRKAVRGADLPNGVRMTLPPLITTAHRRARRPEWVGRGPEPEQRPEPPRGPTFSFYIADEATTMEYEEFLRRFTTPPVFDPSKPFHPYSGSA